jgi:hypothetical protein
MDAPAAPPPPTTTKADVAAARKRLLLEKERTQQALIDACTIGDVVIDATNQKTLKETNALIIIKGACPNQLGANALRQFIINNKLQNYRGKSEVERCKMIVERKKNENLDEVMYGADFDNGADGEHDDRHYEVVGKWLKRLSKGAKQRESFDEGLLSLSGSCLQDPVKGTKRCSVRT